MNRCAQTFISDGDSLRRYAASVDDRGRWQFDDVKNVEPFAVSNIMTDKLLARKTVNACANILEFETSLVVHINEASLLPVPKIWNQSRIWPCE